MTRTLYAIQTQYPDLPGWRAYIAGEDDRGPDNLVGIGLTEAEAIEDLQMILEEIDA